VFGKSFGVTNMLTRKYFHQSHRHSERKSEALASVFEVAKVARCR
jgi:hypothetical protein